MDRQTEDHPERTDRNSRRHDLALRLMAHHARTGTISAMTNLTRHQQDTLRKRWRVTQDMRHRGPAPSSLSVFLGSSLGRSEGAALGVVYRILGLVPARRLPNAATAFFSLESGERLCEAFEVHRACFPDSDLEFEELLLLAIALAEGTLIELGSCGSCGAAMLIDRFAARPRYCSYCAPVHEEPG